MPVIMLNSNLLVLFIIGSCSRRYIDIHKRVQSYDQDDFEILLELINRSSGIVVTPNTLTETSNLVSQIVEPARSELAETFRKFVGAAEEQYIVSLTAASQPEFTRLWLTDAAILRG